MLILDNTRRGCRGPIASSWLRSLVPICLLAVAACHPSAPAHAASGSAGEREARDVIETYEATFRGCKTSVDFGCALQGIDHWHPCDPPRSITQFGVPANEPIDRGYLVGRYFFDGTRCYQATHEAPGTCASLTTTGMTCQDWSSLEACTAARRICSERGR